MIVYKMISGNDITYFKNASDILDELDMFNESALCGDKITFEICEMSEEEYNNFPLNHRYY